MSFESTVQYVQMATRYQPYRARGRVPRGRLPPLLEAEYARRLVAWVDELRGELRALPRLLSEPRHDTRLDSTHGRRVHSLTEPVRRKIDRDLSRLEGDVERTGRGVAAAQKEALNRQTTVALGVEIPTEDRGVPDKVGQFVSKNTTRIRSLGDKLVGEVEIIVIDAWDRGLSEAEVAAEIENRIGVAESYARFLARDQMGALYSQVARARHEEIGVRIFKWWTENDGNVRPSHAVKHGRIFPYRGSRAPSFLPGQEYGCRCWEEPVFDEIKAQAFAGKGRRR